MAIFIGAALDPTATTTNQFLDTVGSRTASINGRRRVKLRIEIQFFSNDLGWRNDQNESCRSQEVKQLCS